MTRGKDENLITLSEFNESSDCDADGKSRNMPAAKTM